MNKVNAVIVEMMSAAEMPVTARTGKNFFTSLLLISLLGCGGGGGGGGSSTTVDTPPPTAVSIEQKEAQTGVSSDSAEVTTSAPLTAVSGDIYLAAISSNPPREVDSVDGLGLSWFPVGEQCSARGKTGITVWQAMGTPGSTGPVTANFDSLPANAAITVSRYTGVDDFEPVGSVAHANTYGLGGGCTGGTDSPSYAFDLDTGASGSLVFTAVAMRNRTHTPGTGFTEQAEISHGSGGSTVSVAVQNATFATPQMINVSGSFNSDVDWAALAVELKPAGSSVPKPDASVEPTSHDYRTVLIGTSNSQAFTITNGGRADLNVSSTSIGGADAGEFTIDSGQAPFSLAPGSTSDITVSFSPSVVGRPNAFLRIGSDDADNNPLEVALTGKAVDTVESDIAVDPINYDYGYVGSDSPSSALIRVYNEGLAELHVQTTSLGGTDMALFTIESGNAPFTVAPGASKDIGVEFAPDSEITASATLAITSDDADQPQVNVSLTGKGVLARDGIWISAEELSSLPMSGWAWEDLKKGADAVPDRQPLSKLASDHDTQTLAIGLVYARTGEEFYRGKALTEIDWAMGTEEGSAQAVGPCRNVVSYIITADLIDLENYDPAFDANFRKWIDEMRFVIWPDGSFIDEDDERTNNHGRMCGAARVAIAVYLDDREDLKKAARVFEGLLGDRDAYDEFIWKDDLSWQADEKNPVGVNPVGAVKQGLNIDGALPEEMRRGKPSGVFAIPPDHTGYPWEALQGILVEAVMLERAGYYDVFDWSDQAILRIVEFIERLALEFDDDLEPGLTWWAMGDDRWVPWVINSIYDTDFECEEASHGKLMAWTDWTHAPCY